MTGAGKSYVRPLLRKGARVAVVSPASAANAELVARGVAALREHGYEPQVMPHALDRGPLYYAGGVEQRLEDLHSAFRNPKIEGVFCTRGGWGSAELLPLLDRELILTHPKVFVGYSDHTSLHVFLQQQCGLATVYGPMVAADWSLPGGVCHASWQSAMSGEAYTLGGHDGLRTLCPGRASGRLLGGCLAIVEAGLGTPWALHIEEPCVLFVEDIGVKPYQWDRMLQHLNFSGVMDRVTGVVFGDMTANVEAREMPLLEAACLHGLRDFDGPVAIGLRCGHVTGGNRTVVLGAESELHCGDEATLAIAGAKVHEPVRAELTEALRG